MFDFLFSPPSITALSRIAYFTSDPDSFFITSTHFQLLSNRIRALVKMSQLLGKRKYDQDTVPGDNDRSVFPKLPATVGDEKEDAVEAEDAGEFVVSLPPKKDEELTKADIFKLNTGTLNLDREVMQLKRLQMKTENTNRLHAAITDSKNGDAGQPATSKSTLVIAPSGEEVPPWHKGSVVWTFNTDYGMMCRARQIELRRGLNLDDQKVGKHDNGRDDDGGYGSDEDHFGLDSTRDKSASNAKDNWRSIDFTLSPGQIADYERLKIGDRDQSGEHQFLDELKKILWMHWIKIESVIAKNIGMESLWQKHFRATEEEQQRTTGALLAYRVSDLVRVGCTTEAITCWMLKQVKQTSSSSTELPLRPLRSYERFSYSGERLVVERVQYATYRRVMELMELDTIDPNLSEQELKDQDIGSLTKEEQWQKDILNTRYAKRADTSAKIDSQQIILNTRNKILRQAINKQLSFATSSSTAGNNVSASTVGKMSEDELEQAQMELLLNESAIASGMSLSSTSNGFGASNKYGSMHTGPPPPNYVCHRCSVRGHWIDMCPQRNKNGGKGNKNGGGGNRVDISAYGEVKSKLVERLATGFLRTDLRLASVEDVVKANNGEVVIYYLPKSSDEKIPQDFQRYVLKEDKRKQLETAHKTTFASTMPAEKFEMKDAVLTPEIVRRASAVVPDPRYNSHLHDDDDRERAKCADAEYANTEHTEYVPPDYFENARKLYASSLSSLRRVVVDYNEKKVEVVEVL